MTKAQVVRALQVVRVLDMQGNISLTNIALVAVLIRTLMIPQLSVHDLLTFLAAIFSYQVKRFAEPASAPEDMQPLKDAVATLQTKVSALQMGQQLTSKRP